MASRVELLELDESEALPEPSWSGERVRMLELGDEIPEYVPAPSAEPAVIRAVGEAVIARAADAPGPFGAPARRAQQAQSRANLDVLDRPLAETDSATDMAQALESERRQRLARDLAEAERRAIEAEERLRVAQERELSALRERERLAAHQAALAEHRASLPLVQAARARTEAAQVVHRQSLAPSAPRHANVWLQDETGRVLSPIDVFGAQAFGGSRF